MKARLQSYKSVKKPENTTISKASITSSKIIIGTITSKVKTKEISNSKITTSSQIIITIIRVITKREVTMASRGNRIEIGKMTITSL